MKKAIIQRGGCSLNGCDPNKRRQLAQQYDAMLERETNDSDFDDIPEVLEKDVSPKY